MRFPQVIVYEGEERVAAALRPLADQLGFSLRHVQQAEASRRALHRGGPNVLVLRTGRDLEREFALLEEVSRQLPETRCVVVLDRDDGRLAALAWDLGATYVVPGGRLREILPDVVRGLLEAEAG